jgi:hypothetical protein
VKFFEPILSEIDELAAFLAIAPLSAAVEAGAAVFSGVEEDLVSSLPQATSASAAKAAASTWVSGLMGRSGSSSW